MFYVILHWQGGTRGGHSGGSREGGDGGAVCACLVGSTWLPPSLLVSFCFSTLLSQPAAIYNICILEPQFEDLVCLTVSFHRRFPPSAFAASVFFKSVMVFLVPSE